MAAKSKTAAGELSQQYGKGSEALFFAGHWGFQYYMETSGGRPLQPKLSDGDILVIPRFNILPEEFLIYYIILLFQNIMYDGDGPYENHYFLGWRP